MPKVRAGINGKKTDLRSLSPKTRSPSISTSGTLRVIKITVNSQKGLIKRELQKIGITVKKSDLDTRLEERSVMILNELSKEARNAVMAKIPVGYKKQRSGLLRTKVQLTGSGAGRSRSFQSGTGTVGLSREVIIESARHDPFYTKFNPVYTNSAALARWLDLGDATRTRPSEGQGLFEGEPKGSSTDWSRKAIQEFKETRGLIIKRVLGKI